MAVKVSIHSLEDKTNGILLEMEDSTSVDDVADALEDMMKKVVNGASVVYMRHKFGLYAFPSGTLRNHTFNIRY